jgi:integrase
MLRVETWRGRSETKEQGVAQIFERSGVWYVRFMHHGKDYCRSTRVPVGAGSRAKESKKAAEAELDRMLAEIRGRESADALFARLADAISRLPAHEQETKRVIFAERLRDGSTRTLAIADAWQAWLDSPKKRRPSKQTIEMYRAYWGRDDAKKHGHRKMKGGFKNWLTAARPEVRFMHEVTPAVAEEYATHLWKSGISPRTYNGTINFLRSVFATLRTNAGMTTDPWHDISKQENEAEGRREFTPGELQKICTTARGALRDWLAIGLYTGLRLGDVVTLRWDEIDFREHMIKRIPNKTRRKRRIVKLPLHPVLETMLRELRARTVGTSEYLFPDDAALYEKGRSSAITKHIQDHFTACGIQTTEKITGQHRRKVIVRVGFHSLRHSFVSLCAANRIPQVAIQEMVGHGSPAMTEHYTHAGHELKAEAIATLPAIKFTPRLPTDPE